MSASTKRKIRQASREAGTDKKLLAEQEEMAKKAKSISTLLFFKMENNHQSQFLKKLIGGMLKILYLCFPKVLGADWI